MTTTTVEHLLASVPRLALLDDEQDVAEGLARGLGRKGFEVALVTPDSQYLEPVLDQIMSVGDAALCDHALRGGFQVAFSGAEVVAALTDRGFPAVLFTGVRPEDRYAIRRNMSRIPGFLHRDHEAGLSATRVLAELADSVQEVKEGARPSRRRSCRTPVTVTGVRRTGRETLVSLIAAGWVGATEIEVPADVLPDPWGVNAHDAVNRTFFARVNVAETDDQKVFFEAFESEPAETERFLGLAEG